jgi:hypothetical protein
MNLWVIKLTNRFHVADFLLALREECKRVFGPRKEKLAGEWRGLRNEELHNLAFHQILLGSSNQGG